MTLMRVGRVSRVSLPVALEDNGQFAEARDQFAQACNNGAAGGCMNAGMMYRDGTGAAPDHARAKRYFTNGCKLGIQDGCAMAEALGQ